MWARGVGGKKKELQNKESSKDSASAESVTLSRITVWQSPGIPFKTKQKTKNKPSSGVWQEAESDILCRED